MEHEKEQDLLEIKEQIERAKSNASELEGRKTLLLEQLDNNWKCKTAEEGAKKVKKLEKELEELEKKIADAIKELEEKYDFE
jgi:hypothetical protein